jgi:3-deoxy-D-manno-octulosonic-acid transferase
MLAVGLSCHPRKTRHLDEMKQNKNEEQMTNKKDDLRASKRSRDMEVALPITRRYKEYIERYYHLQVPRGVAKHVNPLVVFRVH